MPRKKADDDFPIGSPLFGDLIQVDAETGVSWSARDLPLTFEEKVDRYRAKHGLPSLAEAEAAAKPSGTWFASDAGPDPYCLYRINGPGPHEIVSLWKSGHVEPVGDGNAFDVYHFMESAEGYPISGYEAKRIADAWGVPIPGEDDETPGPSDA